METTDGHSGTTSGMESADSSRAPADQLGIQVGNPIDNALDAIARAQDQLRYGRRQEAEGAILQLEEAARQLTFYRSATR